jgi:putative RNA 2'-phosphotransferase
MGSKKTQKQLAGFLAYMLGRKPDEFGLVPNAEGFVKLKDFFQAIGEEEGWRYVRQPILNELLITMPDPPIEIEENRIRATNQDHLPKIRHAIDLPKLLYTTVTQKSHPIVLEKGILPSHHDNVILAAEKEMAVRIGKRRDRSPVLLTVNVLLTEQQGIFFRHSGEKLYLAERIPVNCFTAPPLPKDKPEFPREKKPQIPERPKMPGGYLVDFQKNSQKHRNVADKSGSWKRDKKRIRRQKQKKWPSE